MKRDELLTLLDYHYWARDRMIDAVYSLSPDQFTRGLGSSFGSVRDTVVHIYSAEWVWYSRWQGESPTAMLSPTDFTDVVSVHEAWRAHEQKMRSFFTSLTDVDLARSMAYRSMSGQPSTSVLWHMLQHVVNHATYHRGQITTMLRQLGTAPPRSTDLIAYYRERG
jgi:uncharacterized damage-inducible protein DinB